MSADKRILEAIENCLSADARTYAENKRRGGDNGAKGTRYEDYFFTNVILEAAARVSDDSSAIWPFVQSQCVAFVDDARVACNEETRYHQLKNKQTVSWTAGEHPLKKDFEFQAAVSKHLNEPLPTTHLVVPSKELKEQLTEDMPESISGHSSVLHFPWVESFNRLVLESDELQATLAKLTKAPSPTPDEMVGVFGVVLLASLNFPGGASADEILTFANQYFPNQLRFIPFITDGNELLSDDFKSILDAIPLLTYGAERGYFYYAGGWMTRVLPYDVKDARFLEIQERVVELQPKTLLELEKVIP